MDEDSTNANSGGANESNSNNDANADSSSNVARLPEAAVAPLPQPPSGRRSSSSTNRQMLLRQQADGSSSTGRLTYSAHAMYAHASSQLAPPDNVNVDDRMSLSERLSLHQQPYRPLVPPARNIQNAEPEPEALTEPVSNAASGTTSTTAGWALVEQGGVPPSARSLHAAALLNDTWYVFGGYSGQERVNTFFAFSLSHKQWSPILAAAPPSPRDRHVALAFEHSIYIHGGFDGTQRKADFYEFDTTRLTWQEVVGTGRPPSPRHSHAAVVFGQSAFFYGGYDGSYKSDLTEFDFVQKKWSAVPAAGLRPRARYRATCVVHQHSMILYGGHDGTRHLSDAHVFDFHTRTWSSLNTTGPPPIPRDSHVAVLHGSSMFLFGGSSGTAMNDLHELQLLNNNASSTATTNNNNNNGNNDASNASLTLTGKWRTVHTSRTVEPQVRFCHVACVYNDSLWIFGGYNGSERLNDMYRFDFSVYDLSFEVQPSALISDLRSLINDSTMSDVMFEVQGQPVYAHKLLLMRCSYFCALFSGNMMESRASTIRVEQVSHHVFLLVLEYLYTDQVPISLDNAMDLFQAADLFCIPRLKTMCEKRMLQSITVENAASIFHASDMHSATALRAKAKKYILSNFEEVSKSYSFEEMGRSNIELVFELLQSR